MSVLTGGHNAAKVERKMALLLRSVRRAPWRCEAPASLSVARVAFSTSSPPSIDASYSPSVVSSDVFRELVAEPATTDAIARRLLTYLEVPNERRGRPDDRPVYKRLDIKSAQAPAVVTRLTPLVRWAYQQLKVDADAPPTETAEEEVSREQVEALFDALQPWTNMVRDQIWRQYYLRQFFLSNAPLSAYLAVYERHRGAVSQSRSSVNADGTTSTVVRKNPLPAALIVKEFIWRGRFPEALAAYAELPLRPADRQQIVTLLNELEQYETLLELYRVHRDVRPRLPPLDKYAQLHALVKVGRRDEMERRLQRLSAREQSRADIQALLK